MSQSELNPRDLQRAIQTVKQRLHQIVAENQPLSIEEIYEHIERDPACAPWRRHFWQSSKWAVQSEWKHKIRTQLQARRAKKKIFTLVKGKGWMLADAAPESQS